MKAVVILSGGLDSTVLTYEIVERYGADNVACLSFDYGQKHSIELEKASITCKKLNISQHQILNMQFLGEMYKDVCALSLNAAVAMPTIKDVLGDPAPVNEVPYRNMIMITIALGFAQSIGAGEVFYGAQIHDEYSYWDTSIKFIEKMNNISSLNRKHNIKICAPYATLTKSDEIITGRKYQVPLEDTWTCYSGANEAGEACGKCPSCSERIMNFIIAGIKDPIKYAIDINWADEIAKMEKKIISCAD